MNPMYIKSFDGNLVNLTSKDITISHLRDCSRVYAESTSREEYTFTLFEGSREECIEFVAKIENAIKNVKGEVMDFLR